MFELLSCRYEWIWLWVSAEKSSKKPATGVAKDSQRNKLRRVIPAKAGIRAKSLDTCLAGVTVAEVIFSGP
jgi:hypothetical protein